MTKLELEEQINYPMNSNKLYMDPNKKEDLLRLKKVDENLEINEEYMGLFIPENIKNDFNYEILKNGGIDFDLRKDSFISDLSNQNILLIGRGKDIKKRFHIGIEAMEYIRNEISDSELIIISNLSFFIL